MAWAGATFTSVSDVARAAGDFRNCAATAEFDVYDAVSGKWRWQAWLTNDKVAESTNGYTTKQNALRAANKIRDNAPSATGP